jgi:hypothetical protein
MGKRPGYWILRHAAALALLASAHSHGSATTYFLSPSGSDTSTGTIDAPFFTVGKVLSLPTTEFMPGDTIVARGGSYTYASTTTITRNGTDSARYVLMNFPGERPVFDFSTQPVSSTNRGFNHKGSYWYIRGIDFKGAGDNGMNVTGSNNTIEYCAFYGNHDTGLQLGGGAAYNRIINCDSYDNADLSQGNADGFAPKLDVGTGNYFYGCRSWQNSDDGWDGYMRGADDVTTTLESCWCFANGYLSDGSVSSGNGNGFKTGGSDDRRLKHNMILRNCLGSDNRVKGFDQNNNRGSITILNCTAYRNGINYGFGDTLASTKVLTLKNCAVLGPVGSLHSSAVQLTNSWLAPFAQVTASDFISIDTTGLRAPRKLDGSLPVITFLTPAPGSQLINVGTDVGLPYNGSAPDLGFVETSEPTAVHESAQQPDEFALFQNYPNPFNPTTTIRYTIGGVVALSGAFSNGVEGPAVSSQQTEVSSHVRLAVYDLIGREVAVLVNEKRAPGNYEVQFNAPGLASGTYFYRLIANDHTLCKTMVLLK